METSVLDTVRLDIDATADDAILWRDDRLYLLDQRLLPDRVRFVPCDDAATTAAAIRAMVVRGAPAIGITAGYGVVLAVREALASGTDDWRARLRPAFDLLAQARPTAVNLNWALRRMEQEIDRLTDPDPVPALLAAAHAIHAADRDGNFAMAAHGASLIDPGAGVITHCNTGGLATGGHGTALGVIKTAYADRRIRAVFADETRPWLQGSRLTAWELARAGIPVSLLVDGAAAARMAAGGIDWVIVGADRIAGNGDAANKIGTYGLAVAARHHGVRFMVVAPTSTIDTGLTSGRDIPIEQRDGDEVLTMGDRRLAPADAAAWNPVFDVTPAALIDALVTERGVIHSPNTESIAKIMA